MACWLLRMALPCEGMEARSPAPLGWEAGVVECSRGTGRRMGGPPEPQARRACADNHPQVLKDYILPKETILESAKVGA